MPSAINIDTAGLGNLFTGIGSAAKDIRAAITGKSIIDPAAEAALETRLAEIDEAAQAAQAAVNAAEAASPKLFIAGARPFIMWVCGGAFALNFLLLPITQWIIQICGLQIQLFRLDITAIMPVLLGMLGLGGYRTIEKLQNAQGNH